MLVGILSDSHGHAEPVRRAIEWFDHVGAEFLIHCGDIGGLDVLEELAERPCRFVWGNCDQVTAGTLAFMESVGIEPPPDHPPLRLKLDGKTFAVLHGHEPAFTRLSIDPDTDYLCHGHTHQARNERIHAGRIINPGALHRAHPPTVALLDTHRDTVTFHEIHESPR